VSGVSLGVSTGVSMLGESSRFPWSLLISPLINIMVSESPIAKMHPASIKYNAFLLKNVIG
jgi:hypothetical protein